MTVRNFDSLLKPASVALLGASTKAGSVGAIVAQNLLSGGFAGPIWFVNPKYRMLGDHPCYASVAALPAAPDVAVLGNPATDGTGTD
jgi:acetyltransferase